MFNGMKKLQKKKKNVRLYEQRPVFNYTDTTGMNDSSAYRKKNEILIRVRRKKRAVYIQAKYSYTDIRIACLKVWSMKSENELNFLAQHCLKMFQMKTFLKTNYSIVLHDINCIIIKTSLNYDTINLKNLFF